MFERQRRLIEHGVDRDLGLAHLGGEVAFPGRVAAEFLAHEHLQQHFADRLDRGVGQQQLDGAAAILHVDTQPHQDRGIGRPRTWAPAGASCPPRGASTDGRGAGGAVGARFAAGARRRFRNGAAGDDDPRQPVIEILAGGEAAIEVGSEAVGAA